MWGPFNIPLSIWWWFFFIDKTWHHFEEKYFLLCHLLACRTSSMERQCQAPADWNRASYLGLAGCVSVLSLRLNQLVSETGPVISHRGRISHCTWKFKALLEKVVCRREWRRQWDSKGKLNEQGLFTPGTSVCNAFSHMALPLPLSSVYGIRIFPSNSTSPRWLLFVNCLCNE